MTIFLDLDGTLLDHDAAERSAAIEFFDAFQSEFPRWSPTEFADLWQVIAQKHLDAYLGGRLSFTEQRRERLRELFGMVGVSLSDPAADDCFGVYLEHYERNWRPFPDVVETLDRLQGYVLGMISNGDQYQQESKLERLGLKDRFAHVVISGEVGVAKPNAAIFHEACRRAACAPGESLYVGDRLEADALGSHRAGLHGVWLDRSGSGSCTGDVGIISSLIELPEYVAGLEKTVANDTLRYVRTERAAPRSSCGPRESHLVSKE